MNISLSPAQQLLIENMVAAGRFSSVDEALAEGVRMLAASEKLRQQVQVGIEQADRGELLEHEVVFGRLRMLAARNGNQE